MVEDLNTDIFDSTCPLHYVKEIPRKEKQLVQRHWGRTMPGMLEEQGGGQCVWSRVREGERGRMEGS